MSLVSRAPGRRRRATHQKRTLLLSEHILFRLPHRQFVFTIPKALRVYFRHDRTLFSHVRGIIHRIVTEYYCEVKGFPVTTGTVVSHQTAGEKMNPMRYVLVLFICIQIYCKNGDISRSGYGKLVLSFYYFKTLRINFSKSPLIEPG
jgi:hypothetical protein